MWVLNNASSFVSLLLKRQNPNVVSWCPKQLTSKFQKQLSLGIWCGREWGKLEYAGPLLGSLFAPVLCELQLEHKLHFHSFIKPFPRPPFPGLMALYGNESPYNCLTQSVEQEMVKRHYDAPTQWSVELKSMTVPSWSLYLSSLGSLLVSLYGALSHKHSSFLTTLLGPAPQLSGDGITGALMWELKGILL